MFSTRRRITGQPRKSNLTVNLRHPLLVLERSALATEDGVHFLERQPLGLRDEEPDETRTGRGHQPEQDVRSVGDVFEQIGGDLPDDEVVHPVG